MKMYSQDDVLAEIEKQISKSSLRQVARDKDLSPSQLSDTRTGRIGVSETVARAFGFQKHETIEISFSKAS